MRGFVDVVGESISFQKLAELHRFLGRDVESWMMLLRNLQLLMDEGPVEH